LARGKEMTKTQGQGRETEFHALVFHMVDLIIEPGKTKFKKNNSGHTCLGVIGQKISLSGFSLNRDKEYRS
jgi:hypothetical protein